MQQSIDLMQAKIRKSYQAALADPHSAMRGWAGLVLVAADRPVGKAARAKALQDAFRAKTVYGPDPHLVEQIQSAEVSLCLKPGQCNPLVDCDDETVGVATALLVAGIPVWIVKQDFGQGQQQHVVVGITDDSGKRVRLDPSTGAFPARSAPDEVWVDPVEGMDPLIIGVGAAPRSWIYEQRHGQVWASADDGATWCEVQRNVGLAAPAPDPYAQATVDLANEVEAVVIAGDTYFNAGQYADALASYQAAGQAGATSVGPEIDLAGNPLVTQPITQQAWSLNGKLAAFARDTAKVSDVSVAQGYAKQMLALYGQAIKAGQTKKNAEAGLGIGAAAGIAVGAGAAAGLAWLLVRTRREKSRRLERR